MNKLYYFCYSKFRQKMSQIIILQVTRDELESIVTKAVQEALSHLHKPEGAQIHIKGIHQLADFLKISPGRAQKLKNEKVIPYFQDGRLVLFDPIKVREAMEAYNKKKSK